MSVLLSVLSILLSVAFVTLTERHLLALSQGRVAPSKSGMLGIIQPLIDGLKLMQNQLVLPAKSEVKFFLLTSYGTMVLMLLSFYLTPSLYMCNNSQYTLVLLLILLSLLLYNFIASAFLSISKYSALGSLRFTISGLSFEMAFMVWVLFFSLLSGSLSIKKGALLLGMPLTALLLLMSILLEANRGPLEFTEGESELVSGFNTEMSSLPFIFVFLAEYGFLVFHSMLMGTLLFNQSLLSSGLIFLLILLIRSYYPRYRFEKSMALFWYMKMPVLTIVLGACYSIMF